MYEMRQLGWDWSVSPWAIQRTGDSCLALVGGPAGYFDHQLRAAIRRRELRTVEQRRPHLQGASDIDRRAVFAALKHDKRHAHVTAYQRGIRKAVIAGSIMTTHQLHLAGKVDSGRCPFCELDEDEDVEHLFYRCPAWASQRTKHLHTPVVDTSWWAPVTRTCASVTTPVTSRTHAGWLPPPAGVERRGHLTLSLIHIGRCRRIARRRSRWAR